MLPPTLHNFPQEELAKAIEQKRAKATKKLSRKVQKEAKKKAKKLAEKKRDEKSRRTATLAARRSKWEEEGARLQMQLEEEAALERIKEKGDGKKCCLQ